MRCHRLAWWSPDRTSGGHVRLAVHDEGPAWFWCGLVAVGEPTVLVTDHAVPPPRSSGLEVRSSGLWAEVVVEEPGLHVSVGLEAFGVAVTDPEDAWRGGPTTSFGATASPLALTWAVRRSANYRPETPCPVG